MSRVHALASACQLAGQDTIDRYVQYLLVQRNYSPHTASAYRADIEHLLALDQPWAAIDEAACQQLLRQFFKAGKSPRTLARLLSAWRQFYEWLNEQQLALNNPAQHLKAPKANKPLPKALGVDRLNQLFDQMDSAPVEDPNTTVAADVWQVADRAIFELLYASGLRVSELTSLDSVYVRTKDYESSSWLNLATQSVRVLGKRRKVREVPVGQKALSAIRAWLAVRPASDSPALFIGPRGARITPRRVQLRLQAWAHQHGLKIHPHMLRHSFASHVLQSSGDLRAVQELLGHDSIASTQIYTALDLQHLQQHYQAAHPRARVKSSLPAATEPPATD